MIYPRARLSPARKLTRALLHKSDLCPTTSVDCDRDNCRAHLYPKPKHQRPSSLPVPRKGICILAQQA